MKILLLLLLTLAGLMAAPDKWEKDINKEKSTTRLP